MLAAVDLNTSYDHRHKHQNIDNYSKTNKIAVNTFNSFKYMFENYYCPNKFDMFLFNLIQGMWLKKVKLITQVKYSVAKILSKISQ